MSNIQSAVALCSFSDCDRKTRCKGLCDSHCEQHRAGVPLLPIKKVRKRGTPPVIEWDEVPCPRNDLEGPCRIFKNKYINDDGYGIVFANGKLTGVQRYVWEQANGPIPAGMLIDHQCRNRACVNVAHLRVVTNQINITENVVGHAWQLEAAKTHCPQGHPYDDANTAKINGKRCCRQCRREATMRWYYGKKKREAAI